MFPLLERDGQALSYVALVALFLLLASQCFDFTKKPDAFRLLVGIVVIDLSVIV